MKPCYWKDLAGTARRVPVDPAPEMPFGFDTRVIADSAIRMSLYP